MFVSPRIHASLVAGFLVAGLALVGCGSDDSASSQPAAGGQASSAATSGVEAAKKAVAQYTATQPPLSIPKLPEAPKKGVKLGIVACTIPVCHEKGYGEAAKAIGWDLDFVPFDLAPEPYVAAWGQLLQKSPEVIGFAGVFPQALVKRQLETASQKKIPTVSISTGDAKGPINDAVKACFLCGPSFGVTGKLMADVVVADAGGAAKIVYVDDPSITGLIPVWENFAKELKAVSPESKAEKVAISIQAPQARNASAVVSYLQRNPDVKYAVFSGDQYTPGIPEALASAGLADKVKVIGRSPNPQNLRYIKDGGQFASVAEESVEGTWRVVDALARLEQGVEISDPQPPGWHQIITKENVGDVKTTQPVAPGFPDAFLKAWHVQP